MMAALFGIGGGEFRSRACLRISTKIAESSQEGITEFVDFQGREMVSSFIFNDLPFWWVCCYKAARTGRQTKRREWDMKSIKQIINWFRDSRGVATSLIEATATVAVGAVLAGVAVGGAIDAINNSKVQAAIGDVQAIGTGVITFYKDNSFFPLFADGNKTGASDQVFAFLVSENGTYPTDTSSATSQGGQDWQTGVDTTPWDAGSGSFGTKPGYTPSANGLTGHDSIEGHLIKNLLGNGTGTGSGTYPLRGQYVGDPNKGWAGPYVTSLPKTDPWGDKYIINVRNLHAGYLTEVKTTYAACTSGSTLPSLAVIVLSAGPNRNIETPVDQCFNNFAAQGDDIVFRIK